MNRRINSLTESPCYKCGKDVECCEKVKINNKFTEIRDGVYGDADYDFHNCPLWIALNAHELVEVDE